jgi:molecular chaperone HscB
MPDCFESLGVEPRFDLDLGHLERRHRDLSRALHPDRYAGAPAAERRLALSKAIEVNEAWRTLRDPIRRAEALMRRAGVDVGELAEPKASPALLMDMMDRREALADAAREKNMAEVVHLAEEIRTRQEATTAALARGFHEAAGQPEKLREILPLMGNLRYFRRFLDEVSAIEEQFAT